MKSKALIYLMTIKIPLGNQKNLDKSKVQEELNLKLKVNSNKILLF
jgi:hypothetical protein